MKRSIVFFLLGIGLLLILNANALALSFNNADFEDGTNGWIGGRTAGTIGGFAIDPDAYSGSQAVKITVENADGYYQIRNEQFPHVPITEMYTFNVFLKTAGDPRHVYLAVYKSNSPLIFPTDRVSSMTITNLTQNYQLHQLSGVPLTAGDYIRIEVGLSNSPVGAVSEAWVDLISVHSQELQKAISILQILSGDDISIVYPDINADGKIGMEEALFALQNTSELRIEIYDPVGLWNGNLTGTYGSGQIIDWEMYNDQTITGTVKYYPNIGGETTLDINTTYDFDKNAFSFTATGTAEFEHPQLGTLTSPYTIFVNGVLSSDTSAGGSYTIDFTDPNWTDDSGTWSATKS